MLASRLAEHALSCHHHERMGYQVVMDATFRVDPSARQAFINRLRDLETALGSELSLTWRWV